MNVSIFKLSLNTRVCILTLLIFLISVWSLTGYVNHVLQEDMQHLLTDQQASTTAIVAADINSDFELRIKTLENEASAITSAKLGNAASTQTYLDGHLHLQGMFNAGVFVTGLDGTPIADIPVSADRLGRNVMDRDYMIAALKEGRSSIGRPVLGKSLKSPVFSAAAPIRNAEGKVIGAIVGVTNLGKPNFLDRIADQHYGKSGGYLVVAPQQRLIVSATDKKRIMEILPAPGVNPFIDRAIQGFEDSGVTTTQQGMQVLVSTNRIPTAGWYVAALLPTAEAFAPIYSVKKRLLLSVLFLSLTACGLTWWFIKSQRVHKLLERRVEERTRELRKSRDEWVRTFNAIPDKIMILDTKYRIIHANQATEPLPCRISDTNLTCYCHNVEHGLDEPLENCPHISLLFDGNKHEEEILDPLLNRYFHISVAPLFDDGELVGSVHIARDITAIKQAEKFEQFRSHTLELLAQDVPLTVILAAIVRGVEQLNPAMLCSILLLDSEGRHLGNGVAFSLPDFYNAAIEGIEIGLGVGSCGTAAFTGERIIVDDIATHPYWAPFKELAASAGLGACWSQPILSSSGHVLGTFAIYHHEARTPGELEITTIEQAANLASIAIDKSNLSETLHASELRFRSFVENANDVLFSLTPEGYFSYVSPLWQDAFGYEPNETIGQPFGLFVHPDDVAGCVEFIRLTLMSGKKQSGVEYRVLCKDGRYVWYKANASPVTDPVTGALAFIGIGRDITERKRAEEELRLAKATAEAAKEKLSLSAKAGGVAFWEYDVINNKLYWDDQMYLLYGVRPDTFENVYQAWTAVLHPDDILRVNEDVRKALSGEKEYELDFRVVWPDYSIHTISAAGKVQRDAAGQPVSMLGTNWDITKAKQVEEELLSFSRLLKEKNSELNEALIATEQANAAKSQFLSNMSHEIRTPLNAIIGFSSLLLNTTLPPRQHDYIGKIHSAGELLLNIVNDILDFSKVEARQLQIEQITFRPAIIIDNVISMVQQKAFEKGLQLLVDTSPEIAPYLIGDPHRLIQIMTNLLSNAVKFTEQGEVELTLTVLKQDNGRQQIKVSIRDTGIGLSGEQIKKLFKPFTQADESTTRRFGGTGLGLSICKLLLELMEGEISCESRPGLGTVFSFTAWFGIGRESDLLEQSQMNFYGGTEGVRPAYDFTAFHILLVEDNETNQQLAIELLKESGAGVDVAADGSEAVTLVTTGSRRYDLLLMDVQMPVMDGYEATRLIRADRRFATLPIIAMTAYALQEEQAKIIETGMNALIPKPVDARTMLRTIASFLGVQASDGPAPDRHESGTAVAAIPDIAGLDTAAALERLEGNENLYTWLLRSFVDNKSNAVQEIEEALSGGDTLSAMRHAHTIKSSAGSIGAVALTALALQLETTIDRGEPHEQIEAALASFAIEMEHTVRVLMSYLPPVQPKSDNPASGRQERD